MPEPEPLVVDLYTFVGDSLHGHGQTATELLARMDAAGVDQSVICPTKPPAYHLGPANDTVAAAARTNPRLVPFARVDPHQGSAALRELDRAVAELGARGLFLHPWEETFRISSLLVDPLADRLAGLGLPLLVAAGYPWLSEAPQVGELARRFPHLPIVMSHGGQINISGLGQFDAWQVLEQRANVSIETSGVYRQDFLEEVVGAFGPERVLFGSSSPVMDSRLEVERVRLAKLPEAARRLMLGGNAQRLLRLAPA
jgi:predicted TIM-barrel fold metal-dependent hydrolase